MKKYFVIIIISIIAVCNSFAAVNLNKMKLFIGKEYTVVLDGGDIISGELSEFYHSPEEGEAIKIITDFGKATLYESQIKEIVLSENYYRHKNRLLLLPTAYPIEDNHYFSDMELAFPNAGFGISDFLSVTGGFSLYPANSAKEFIYMANAKFTILQLDFDDDIQDFALAAGVNSIWLNTDNNISHIYGVGSVRFSTTSISAGLFYKIGADDFYKFRALDNVSEFAYSDGAMGLAFGIDKELSKNGLHLFFEIWNGDITRSYKSALGAGIRFSNREFASDFGVFYLAGYPIPIMNFAWTPF